VCVCVCVCVYLELNIEVLDLRADTNITTATTITTWV